MTANSERNLLTNPITMATNIKLTTQKLQTLFEQSVPLWKEQPGGSIQPVPNWYGGLSADLKERENNYVAGNIKNLYIGWFILYF